MARSSDEAIDRRLPLAPLGGQIPGLKGGSVDVLHTDIAAIFSMQLESGPIATCGLAWTPEGAQSMWKHIETLYFGVTDMFTDLPIPPEAREKFTVAAKMPDAVPWVAEVRFPIPGAAPDFDFMYEFLQSMAWAILVSRLERVMSLKQCKVLYDEAHRAGLAGNVGLAQRIFQALVTYRPDDSEFALGLGRTLRDLGRNEEALEALRRAEFLNPQDRMTQFEIGASLIALKRFLEAEDNFRRALALPKGPKDHPTLEACAQDALSACIKIRLAHNN